MFRGRDLNDEKDEGLLWAVPAVKEECARLAHVLRLEEAP